MNQPKWTLVACLLALILALGASVVGARHLWMGSANYLIAAGVLSAGGGRMSSAGYQMRGTLGQGLVGRTESSSFVGNSGFWQPAYAPAVTISPGYQLGIVLAWPAVPIDANGYQVWWSTAPYVQPGDAGAGSTLLPPSSTGLIRPNSSGVNYFYVMQGINGLGQVSPLSKRTGQFLFSITPGAQ
jgi:hypothetical protein